MKFCIYPDTIAFFDASNPDGDVSSDHLHVKVGDTLTATVTGGEAPYSYQWYADGEEIKGATNSTYNVTSYDLGKELSVAVMDADGNSDLSDETDAVVEKFALSEVLLDNT